MMLYGCRSRPRNKGRAGGDSPHMATKDQAEIKYKKSLAAMIRAAIPHHDCCGSILELFVFAIMSINGSNSTAPEEKNDDASHGGTRCRLARAQTQSAAKREYVTSNGLNLFQQSLFISTVSQPDPDSTVKR